MSEYGYDDTDGANVKVLSRTHPRARKDRPCSDCGRTIKAGQQYTRIAYLLDGEFRADATHVEGGMCNDHCGCAG